MAELAVEGRRLLCLADVVGELALKDGCARQREGNLHRALCPRVRLRDERDMARHARTAHRRRGGEVHVIGAVLDFCQLVEGLVERTPRIDRDILLLGNDLLRRVLACFFIGRSLDFFLCNFLVCSLGRLRCGRFSRYDCRRSRVVCGLCRLCARHAIRCQGQCQPQQDGGHLLAACGTHRAVHEMELHQMSLLYPACRRRLRTAVFFVLVLILITLFSEIQEKSFSKEGFLLA